MTDTEKRIITAGKRLRQIAEEYAELHMENRYLVGTVTNAIKEFDKAVELAKPDCYKKNCPECEK